MLNQIVHNCFHSIIYSVCYWVVIPESNSLIFLIILQNSCFIRCKKRINSIQRYLLNYACHRNRRNQCFPRFSLLIVIFIQIIISLFVFMISTWYFSQMQSMRRMKQWWTKMHAFFLSFKYFWTVIGFYIIRINYATIIWIMMNNFTNTLMKCILYSFGDESIENGPVL